MREYERDRDRQRKRERETDRQAVRQADVHRTPGISPHLTIFFGKRQRFSKSLTKYKSAVVQSVSQTACTTHCQSALFIPMKRVCSVCVYYCSVPLRCTHCVARRTMSQPHWLCEDQVAVLLTLCDLVVQASASRVRDPGVDFRFL